MAAVHEHVEAASTAEKASTTTQGEESPKSFTTTSSPHAGGATGPPSASVGLLDPTSSCPPSASRHKFSEISSASSSHFQALGLSCVPESSKAHHHDDTTTMGTNCKEQAIMHPVVKFTEGSKPIFQLTPMNHIPLEADISDFDVHLLHKAHHKDPFAILGPHHLELHGEQVIHIRGWVKDARSVRVRCLRNSSCIIDTDNGYCEMKRRCDWLFQACFKVTLASSSNNNTSDDASRKVDADTIRNQIFSGVTKLYYEFAVQYEGDNSNTEYEGIRDPYSFGILLPSYDLDMFRSGSCWHVDSLMGSHIVEVEGCLDPAGVRFACWAPSASFVSVVGDFNQWDGRAHPMRKRHEYGVWEIYVPIARAGQKYGYRIHSEGGFDIIKIDPYAQEFENPPAHASVISSCDDPYKTDKYEWKDSEWMATRASIPPEELHRSPMSIYEVHLPSWMRGEHNQYLSYREIADRLVQHVKFLNFTHVEFLPLAHHPFEGSWGYQVSGLYAPYSRLGNPDDLKYLVDTLHQNGIGVYIDFVPAHFVKDEWGLVYYDGKPCYEYADPREGEHRQWGTMVFNFRRNEVRSFLLGAAYHWLRRYHFDGLRIDAVSSMLYKNHCREADDWVPNEFGGDANLQAISFLQEMNWVIHREFPGVFMMAEESTSWQGVTDQEKGLGFDVKWDLGWMNDMLSYLCTPIDLRPNKHSKLTFRGLYMAHENWVLPLSHDEVVSGKGSLVDKCGFTHTPFECRVSNLKALFGVQIGMPGRPLLFMGAEFAQGREWKEARSLDWHESKEEQRGQVMEWLRDILYLYKTEKALHAGDNEPWNFKWSDCDNSHDCVMAWIRHYQEWHNDILIVCNFSGRKFWRYPLGVPHGGAWRVIANSDDWKYGGSMSGPGNGNEVQTTQGGRLGWPYCVWTDLPPYGCIMFKAPVPNTTSEAKKVDSSSEMGDTSAVEQNASITDKQE